MPGIGLIPGGTIGVAAALVGALAVAPTFAAQTSQQASAESVPRSALDFRQSSWDAFEYGGLFIGDWTRNIGGGANPDSSAGRYWLSIHLEADLEQLFDLPATTFGMDLWHIAGDNGSIDVGSLQETSYLDAEPDSLLAQAWVRHEAMEGMLAFQVGRIDANEHFYSTDIGANFHNAAAALPVSMMGIVSYPDPVEGGFIDYQLSESSYLKSGVFDLDNPAVLVEVGYHSAADAHFAAGGWYYSGDFDCWNGNNCDGANGFYFSAEGTIIPEHNIDGLGRVAFSDDSISPFGHHTALGVVWREPFAAREQDEFGILHLHGDLSTAPGSPFTAGAEQIWEGYYRFVINQNVAVQPCLQFVSNPGGQYEDTLVPCIRIEVTF